MKKNFNSSYRFSFGNINFQIDIDETLSSEINSNNSTKSKYLFFHSHPFYELFFVFDEELEIVFENERKKYLNCIVCLPPNFKHYSLRSSDYRILFSYSKKNNAKGGFESFITDFLATETVCQFPVTVPLLKGYLKELCDVFYNQESELDSEAIVSLLKCIIYRMYSLLYSPGESIKKTDYSTKESRCIIIDALIAKCKKENINITTIADALCISKKQASRIIYKYYGKPLSEIITEEKLNYAAFLLKNTNLSVCDIALESNFQSYSYFCHQFKKKFGCVPLHYRKQQANMTTNQL